MHPIEASTLPESDVRAMVRLLGEVIAVPGDINTKRRLLMDGLCEIIHATNWVWCMAEFDPDKPTSYISIIHSGFDDESFARYLQAMNHPDMEPVTRPSSFELQAKSIQLTQKLHQITPVFHLKNLSAAPACTQAGIGALMTSQRQMPGGSTSGISVYRNLGLPHFDQREVSIAQIILSEVPWLHCNAFPDKANRDITRLSPRNRTVLNLLGDGWSRKRIAAHLDISENTIHGYVKDIFKHFAVHSQSELLARIAKGDSGDQ